MMGPSIPVISSMMILSLPAVSGQVTAPPKSMEFCGTDFGCIFHTCRILGCAKWSPVHESTKCRFRPRRHSTANVSSAARVFGSRTAVRSTHPYVCGLQRSE